MAAIHAVLILAQCILLHGFLFDNVVNVVTVSSPVGDIVGKIETVTFDGQQYNVKEFLGIPYAEPPLGDKRFTKPVPKANFSHPLHAFDYGSACLQGPDPRVSSVNIPTSEDCLFLNIFTPERANASSNIPVMVWIHGGGFLSGVSTYYHGDVLSAFGDVIVVTMNYRLAQLGFLRVDDDTGNFGLWDQHLALQWVKDNIASFGGDINRITLFGESAGSSSVTYQSLFPGNKNLFQRVIAQSGSITSPWGYNTNKSASMHFDRFASFAGCNGTHDNIMLCLRNIRSTELSNLMTTYPLESLIVPNALIMPNRDRDFVPADPSEMLKASPDLTQSHDFFRSLDLMTGSTSLEGGLWLPFYAYTMNITDLEKFSIPENLYESFFVPNVLSNVYGVDKIVPQVVKDVTLFEYTNYIRPANDGQERVKLLTKLTTDTALLVPMVTTARFHSQASQGNTYMYEFSTSPATHVHDVPSWMDGPTVATHGDDYMFVFGFSPKMVEWYRKLLGGYRVSDEDIRTAKVIMGIWTNFAKTG